MEPGTNYKEEGWLFRMSHFYISHCRDTNNRDMVRMVNHGGESKKIMGDKQKQRAKAMRDREMERDKGIRDGGERQIEEEMEKEE